MSKTKRKFKTPQGGNRDNEDRNLVMIRDEKNRKRMRMFYDAVRTKNTDRKYDDYEE